MAPRCPALEAAARGWEEDGGERGRCGIRERRGTQQPLQELTPAGACASTAAIRAPLPPRGHVQGPDDAASALRPRLWAPREDRTADAKRPVVLAARRPRSRAWQGAFPWGFSLSFPVSSRGHPASHGACCPCVPKCFLYAGLRAPQTAQAARSLPEAPGCASSTFRAPGCASSTFRGAAVAAPTARLARARFHPRQLLCPARPGTREEMARAPKKSQSERTSLRLRCEFLNHANIN